MPGPKPHEPTKTSRAFVLQHVKAGVTQERIAKAIGMSVDSLAKYYRDELDSGTGSWEVGFEKSFLQRAMEDDPKYASLAIFVAKVKLGYRETVAIDPTKEKPVGEMSEDELRAVIANHARRSRGDGGAGTARQEDRAA